jgi:hypothetical protein
MPVTMILGMVETATTALPGTRDFDILTYASSPVFPRRHSTGNTLRTLVTKPGETCGLDITKGMTDHTHGKWL